MPNAVTNPGPGDNAQVVVDSSHNGKEPQVAKIYQELQRRPECKPFSENMIREKADYFLLLQHGGGKGNRWALSDKSGNVIASGDSFRWANSVKAACLAIGKDWQRRRTQREKSAPFTDAPTGQPQNARRARRHALLTTWRL